MSRGGAGAVAFCAAPPIPIGICSTLAKNTDREIHVNTVPIEPAQQQQPDEDYAEEFAAVKRLGIPCSIYSVDGFEAGDFLTKPPLQSGDEVLYRGWMLDEQRYANLQAAVERCGARLITSLQDYLRCHHLPGWYDQCADYTPKTVFLREDSDFDAELSPLRWSRFFVKDYVKSLTTSRGSVAADIQEVREVVGLIRKYRGSIEGGVCVREFEALLPETEERYFVFRGKPYSRDDVVPEIVANIAARIQSPFYSVDIVQNVEGVHRLIELGDGQVSDRKKWFADKFVGMFK